MISNTIQQVIQEIQLFSDTLVVDEYVQVEDWLEEF
jgi:hypothetical protein